MPKLNSFEKAQNAHNKVLERNPIGRVAMLNSLQKLRETGSSLVRNEEIGMVRYANIMHKVLSNAVELQTQPPMNEDHKNVLRTEISGLEAITHANGESQAMTEPTDMTTTDTAKRKA